MTDGFFSDYVCVLCAFVFEWALLVLVTLLRVSSKRMSVFDVP